MAIVLRLSQYFYHPIVFMREFAESLVLSLRLSARNKTAHQDIC